MENLTIQAKGRSRVLIFLLWVLVSLLVLVSFAAGATQNPAMLVLAAYLLLVIGLLFFRRS